MDCKICGTPYSPEREVDEDGNICAWSKNCECKELENIPLDKPVGRAKNERRCNMQELITKILLEIQDNLSASNMDYLDVLNRMLNTLLAYNKE